MAPEVIRLHSAYNPVREAERFIAKALPEENPRVVVITEPGESYLAEVLRQRLPSARLIALRYTPDLFFESDKAWDAVWRPLSDSSVFDFLYQQIPEELIPVTAFLSWNPSDNAWPEISASVWNGIKELVKLQSGIIRTRDYFGKRWLGNIVYNMAFSRNPVEMPSISAPVLLACAGPSLETIFPFDSKRFFTVAVSSALTCMLAKKIFPDVCVTTDGGYWARRHLEKIPEETVLAFPLEAAVPRDILERNRVVFMNYESALEQTLYQRTNIHAVKAERNGTVAGTAVRFLLDTTDGPIIAAGLDLQMTKSFSHARPHAFDTLIDSETDRTAPLCGVLYGRSGNTMPLDAYARWFSANSSTFDGRVFRIESSKRPIPGIPQASVSDVAKNVIDKPEYHSHHSSAPEERMRLLRDFLLTSADQIEQDSEVIHVDPVLRDLVQYVSFTGYISMVKTGDSQAVCHETVSFLRDCAKKVQV